MNQQRTLEHASLSQLLRGCHQEQAQLATTSQFSYELFRRALELGDDHAWFGLQQQFRPLFVRWILELTTVGIDHFVVEDMLQVALERFWCTLSASSLTLAERFPHTGALLKYMKLCLKSAYYEWQRRETRQQRLKKHLAAVHISAPVQRPLEQLWSNKIEASRCLAVRHCLEENCRDEAEKLIYQLSYVENLKPRQIVARHPEHFPAVHDVYRIKLRLYRRVQRAVGGE